MHVSIWKDKPNGKWIIGFQSHDSKILFVIRISNKEYG